MADRWNSGQKQSFAWPPHAVSGAWMRDARKRRSCRESNVFVAVTVVPSLVLSVLFCLWAEGADEGAKKWLTTWSSSFCAPSFLPANT